MTEPAELTWIRSHVERCLQDEWGCAHVTVDGRRRLLVPDGNRGLLGERMSRPGD